MWIDVFDNWNIENYWLTSFFDFSLDVFNKRFIIKQKIKNIQIKKMNAILYDMRFWLNRLRNARLFIYCDNEVVCYDLIFEFMKDEIMMFFRQIVMFLIFHDIVISITWIDSKFNHLTNFLSRDLYDVIVNEYSQLSHFQHQNWKIHY